MSLKSVQTHFGTQLSYGMSRSLRMDVDEASPRMRIEVEKPDGEENPFAVPALAVNYLPTQNSPSNRLAHDLTAFYRHNLQCSSAIISPSDVGSNSADEFRICEFASLSLGNFRHGNRMYHQIEALLEAERNKLARGQTEHMTAVLQPISYVLELQTGKDELSAGADYWQKACKAIRNSTGRSLAKAQISALELDLQAYRIWNKSTDFYLDWIRYLVWKHLQLLSPLSDDAVHTQMRRLEDILNVARLKLDLINLENSLQSKSLAFKPSTTTSSSVGMTGVVSELDQTHIGLSAPIAADPHASKPGTLSPVYGPPVMYPDSCVDRRDRPPHSSPSSLGVPPIVLATATALYTPTSTKQASRPSEAFRPRESGRQHSSDVALRDSIDAAQATATSSPYGKHVRHYDSGKAQPSPAAPVELLATEPRSPRTSAFISSARMFATQRTMKSHHMAPSFPSSFTSSPITVSPPIGSPAIDCTVTSTCSEPAFGAGKVRKEPDTAQRRLPDISLQSLVDASREAATSAYRKNAHTYDSGTAEHCRASPIELLDAVSPLSLQGASVPHVELPSAPHDMNAIPHVPSLTAVHNLTTLDAIPTLPLHSAMPNHHLNRPNATSVMDSAPACTIMHSALSPIIRKRKVDEESSPDSPDSKEGEPCRKKGRASMSDCASPPASFVGHDATGPAQDELESVKSKPKRRGKRGLTPGQRAAKLAAMNDDQKTVPLSSESNTEY